MEFLRVLDVRLTKNKHTVPASRVLHICSRNACSYSPETFLYKFRREGARITNIHKMVAQLMKDVNGKIVLRIRQRKVSRALLIITIS
jgi:hypothetical protein